jgi:hypothetical protein
LRFLDHTQLDTQTQHPVELVLRSDQPFAETATYTTHKLKRRTSMRPEGFEPATLAVKRLLTYALDRLGSGT